MFQSNFLFYKGVSFAGVFFHTSIVQCLHWSVELVGWSGDVVWNHVWNRVEQDCQGALRCFERSYTHDAYAKVPGCRPFPSFLCGTFTF